MAGDEIDLEGRELCADGACTGVLGADRRCGECGRTIAEAIAGRRPVGHVAAPADDDLGAGDDEGGLDLAARELCPDGACLGVLDPAGRCPLCGRAAPRG